MDTNKTTDTDILDFTSFIKKYFPKFEIDGFNLEVIRNLGLWATRNEKFNNKDKGWHLDRGILISGPVGIGKDELFVLLWKYLSYLRSPYLYASKVVWEFAGPFEKNGYECFREHTGNIYYEELALTTESTGQPTREYVSHFGTKLLIGSEIINIRYKVFKNTGYQTHFSTNLNETDLEVVYGERCMSRLYEMCNYMPMAGHDRRGRVVPAFKTNKNQPVAPPAPRELSFRAEEENKKAIEDGYQHYLNTKELPEYAALLYNSMVAFDVRICDDEMMRMAMEHVESKYVDNSVGRQTSKEKADKKRDYIWEQSRKLMLQQYYKALEQHGCKSVFGIREVNVDQEIKPVVEEIKGKA